VHRATLDNLFEAIAVYGEDGRLKLYNPAFCALWGLNEADVAGEPHIVEIVDRARHLLDEGGNWERLREELIAQVTCQMLTSAPVYRRDGVVLQAASVPLPDGEVLLTYLDISDTANVERALRERNQALETAARLKTEFVANVSHEMRTPLSSVIGFAEILDKQYFGPLNPSQREYSRLILDSAHQLLGLINDVIDLATIEAGEIELRRAAVDVSVLLHGIAHLTRDRAKSREVNIEVRCPAGIGTIDADERRLKQALFNLVTSAIRFTLPGGSVCVEAERRGDALLLHVAEHAPALSLHQGPTDPRAARPQNFAITGFGLSLVKSLVEMHGGRLEIETEGDCGPRVTCRLPVGVGGLAQTVLETGAAGREPSDSRSELAV
jgi:signal transduction histidine kinase